MPRLPLSRLLHHRCWLLSGAGLLTAASLSVSVDAVTPPGSPAARETRPVPAAEAGARPATVSDGMHMRLQGAPANIAGKLEPEVDLCELPMATCATLVPQRVQPQLNTWAMSGTAAAPVQLATAYSVSEIPTAEQSLRVWELLTASALPVPDREQVWMRRMNDGTVTAHAVEAVIDLLGPVSARSLSRKYDWTVENSAEPAIVMTATPRDAMDRLFANQFRVLISPESRLVTAVEVQSRAGQWNKVMLPPAWSSSVVQTNLAVAGESQVVAHPLPPSPLPAELPAPAPLLRLAAEPGSVQRQ